MYYRLHQDHDLCAPTGGVTLIVCDCDRDHYIMILTQEGGEGHGKTGQQMKWSQDTGELPGPTASSSCSG